MFLVGLIIKDNSVTYDVVVEDASLKLPVGSHEVHINAFSFPQLFWERVPIMKMCAWTPKALTAVTFLAVVACWACGLIFTRLHLWWPINVNMGMALH